METTAPPKAYSYLRFSTPEQMRGDSFRRQSAMAEAYAQEHGLQLDTTLTFHDLGVSAYRGKNLTAEGQLGLFLQAISEGIVPQGSYLLVESLDRISRQTARRALRALENVVDAGAVVVTLNDGRRYDSESLNSDPVALLLSILTFMRAHEESSTKAARLKAAWAAKRSHAAASGKPMTGMCPAWLKFDQNTGTFLPIAERVVVVQRIFEMTLSGHGQDSIAQTLNREGIPPFGRGIHWHRTYIAKVLDNPAVYGAFVPHVEDQSTGKLVRRPLDPIEDYFPTIIAPDTLERFRSMRAGSVSPRRGRHAAKPLNNLFGGLGRCALCGGSMTMSNKGDGNKYFVCTRAKAGAGCTYKSTPYQPIEDCFLSVWPEILATAAGASEQAEGIRLSLINIKKQLDWVEQTKANIIQLIESGTPQQKTPAALLERLSDLERDRIEALRLQQDYLLREKMLDKNAFEIRVTTLRQLLVERPVDKIKVNALLRQFFKAIVISAEQKRLDFHWQHSNSATPVFFSKDGSGVVRLPHLTVAPPVPALPTVFSPSGSK